MPPPRTVRPASPCAALPATVVAVMTSGPPGGPFGIGASTTPPPRTVPVRPCPVTLLSRIVVLRKDVPLSPTSTPPAAAVTSPCGAVARTVLPLMTPLLNGPQQKIDPPADAEASPDADDAATLLLRIMTAAKLPLSSPAPESADANAAGAVVDAVTALFVMTTWSAEMSTSLCRPPEKALESPAEFVIVTEF